MATEESLDHWHAQSLGISTEKLIKAKRYLLNYQPGHEKGADHHMPTKKKPQAAHQLSLGTLIQQQRPINYRNKVQYFDHLQPQQYARYDCTNSFVLQKNLSKSAAKPRDTYQQALEQKAKREGAKRKNRNATSAFSSSKNKLLQDVGGFSSKHIYQRYIEDVRQQQARVKELRRKEAESREMFERVQQQNLKRLVPVVEEEKLKKQKKDIAQLIEQNINIEYEKTIA